MLLGTFRADTQNSEVVSLPLDARPYREIIANRGRVGDADRLERLISRFRGEQHIDRADATVMNGERVLWVSNSPEKLAARRDIERLRGYGNPLARLES